MKELKEKEKKIFIEWSEGNQYLYDLLCVCWENEISTFASCGGHENADNSPYLGIILNDTSLSFMKNILAHLQDMKNIAITSDVRGPREQLFDDKELKSIAFYSRNYNCCEMFYKMKKGIEDKSQNVKLTQEANIFYDSLRRLNETSRKKLQEYINNNLVVGSTFSTPTQDFIDYQNSNKMIRNSKVIRFFRKLLPFIKENNKYKQLQIKYGFLQRKYYEESNKRIQQYKVENLDNQENQANYDKKVKDIEPIENSGEEVSRETLPEFIEEPCLDACKYLYDLNIRTTMSSANKKDVGGYGYIHIDLNSLSEENKKILLKMLEKSEARISLGTEHGSIPIKIISIETPITEETTIGDTKNGFMQIISALKIQDVLYGRYSREDIVNYIKNGYGQDLEINDELIKDMGFCYYSDENVYFENEELLKKHLKYINRESNLEK